MRVLVLGGTGMLGHKLVQCLPSPIEAFATVRTNPDRVAKYGFFCPDRVVPRVDANDFTSIERAFHAVKPAAVVNCIGIVKQHALAKDPIASLTINALLPHRLNALCGENGARLVHVSTDCVFDGMRGGYTEDDATTAEDLYGKTKALGEVVDGPGLTLRTSIIGRELVSGTGLVEWFLSQKGATVKGFTQARFSGLTTQELANVIAKVLIEHREMTGLWQVASEPIDKCALLALLNDSFKTGTEIVADNSVHVDRALCGAAFRSATGYAAPAWSTMVATMASDPTPYEAWRN
jgi:dTDP-4-dehydrorhamnose reductase